MKKSFFLIPIIFTMLVGCATAPEVVKEPTVTSKTALEVRKQEASDLVAKGNIELNKKDFDMAILYYQEALKMNPQDGNINRKLGEAKRQKESILKLATSIASKVPVSSKVVAEQHLETAKNLEKANKIDEAINILKKADEIDPGNIYPETKIKVLFNLGIILHNKREYDKALEYYQKALKLNPKDGNLNRNLGILYIHINRINEARTHLETAIIANQYDKEALLNLASLYQIMADSLKGVAQQLIDRAGQIP